MLATLQTRYKRVEVALDALLDSVTAYNPSIVAAEELLAADDNVNAALETLVVHQRNQAHLASLQATSTELDEQIKSTLRSLAAMRKTLLAIKLPKPNTRSVSSSQISSLAGTGAGTQQRGQTALHPVRVDELLSYAKFISKTSAAPRRHVEADTQDDVGAAHAQGQSQASGPGDAGTTLQAGPAAGAGAGGGGGGGGTSTSNDRRSATPPTTTTTTATPTVSFKTEPLILHIPPASDAVVATGTGTPVRAGDGPSQTHDALATNNNVTTTIDSRGPAGADNENGVADKGGASASSLVSKLFERDEMAVQRPREVFVPWPGVAQIRAGGLGTVHALRDAGRDMARVEDGDDLAVVAAGGQGQSGAEEGQMNAGRRDGDVVSRPVMQQPQLPPAPQQQQQATHGHAPREREEDEFDPDEM